MPTKISFQTWSGGSGMGDERILLGYCKESPVEVLQKVYKKYNIYYYEDLYRPVDYRFPNNVEGLVIEGVKEFNIDGCEIKITGTIKNINLSRAYHEKVERNKNTFEYALEQCKNWSLNDTVKKYSKLYNERLKQFKEVEEVLFSDKYKNCSTCADNLRSDGRIYCNMKNAMIDCIRYNYIMWREH